MRWPYLIPVAVVLIIVGVLALGLNEGDPTRVPSPLINRPAPKFSISRVFKPGQQLSRADLLGHVSVVNVWASWCVSCKDEHPVLLDLANRHVVKLYGLDYKDTRAAAKAWLQSEGDPYNAVGFDPQGNVGINFGVYGVPETYVIDPKGVIRRKFIGPLTPKILNNTLIPLIDKLKRTG